MYLHVFCNYTNYICIEHRYVNDKIAHKLISAALLFSLQNINSYLSTIMRKMKAFIITYTFVIVCKCMYCVSHAYMRYHMCMVFFCCVVEKTVWEQSTNYPCYFIILFNTVIENIHIFH